MSFNASIYGNQYMADFDPVGSIQKGMSMADAISKKKLRDKKIEAQERFDKTLPNYMSRDDSGRINIDFKGLASDEAFKDNPLGADHLSFAQTLQDRNNAIYDRKEQLDFNQKHANRMYEQGQERNRIAKNNKGLARAQKIADRNEQRAYDEKIRKENLALKEKDKKEELHRKTFIPGIGYAMNADDAKKLKDATQLKAKLDSQLGEMIELRKKYGVEYFNREAVGRGKQLSKDLLLTYKNLAKLGVLSKSDEDIINTIIPSDPLGHDGVLGQDSILSNLEKFKVDIDNDYLTNLNTRLKSVDPDSALAQKLQRFKRKKSGLAKKSGYDSKPSKYRDAKLKRFEELKKRQNANPDNIGEE